jgi:hypothetical protein
MSRLSHYKRAVRRQIGLASTCSRASRLHHLPSTSTDVLPAVPGTSAMVFSGSHHNYSHSSNDRSSQAHAIQSRADPTVFIAEPVPEVVRARALESIVAVSTLPSCAACVANAELELRRRPLACTRVGSASGSHTLTYFPGRSGPSSTSPIQRTLRLPAAPWRVTSLTCSARCRFVQVPTTASQLTSAPAGTHSTRAFRSHGGPKLVGGCITGCP